MKKLIQYLFTPDYEKFHGISRFKIYLLRIVCALTFLFVGYDSWLYILTHEGVWMPMESVAFSVWATYSVLSVLGIIHTVKMLPLMLFQVMYKLVWLIVVALPLAVQGTLTGSPVEELTYVFLTVVLPMVGIPWKYLYRNYIISGFRSVGPDSQPN